MTCAHCGRSDDPLCRFAARAGAVAYCTRCCPYCSATHPQARIVVSTTDHRVDPPS